MNTSAARLIQTRLAELGHYHDTIDGKRGPNTHAAVNAALATRSDDMPPGWRGWTDKRKSIGFLQLMCHDEDIDAGDIDGRWGPQTQFAFDALTEQRATGNPPVNFRDIVPGDAKRSAIMHRLTSDDPDEASEVLIVRLVRGAEGEKSGQLPVASEQSEPIREQAVFEARAEIHGIHVSEIIEQYIVQLITATRHPDRYSDELKTWIQVGASPRGSIGLDKCARVHAWLQAEDYVTPDNVRAVVHDVLRHRLILSYEANAAGVTANDVISEIVKQVAVA